MWKNILKTFVKARKHSLSAVFLLAWGGFFTAAATAATAATAEDVALAEARANAEGKASDLGGPITINGSIALQGFFSQMSGGKSAAYPYGVGDVVLDAKISENVRAHILILAYQNLLKMGVERQKIDEILYEAYIKITNVGGKPIAFIIGKQSVAFGQTLMKLPNAGSDPSIAVSSYDQVIGLTVSLEKVGFFDLVDASVFETGQGDLKIGTFDGGAIRLTKKLSDKLKFQVSAMHAGKGSSPDEDRQSVGFVFKDGGWTFWAQGIHMAGNSYFPNSNWSAIVGGEYKWENQRIVVQAWYLSEGFTSVSIGYSVEVSQDVFLSPEVRYITRADGTVETQYIVLTSYRFHVN